MGLFDWLFKGKAKLFLPKYSYSYGETIQGSFSVAMKKAQLARAITVKLYAQERVTSGYGKERRTSTHTIYEQEIPLSQEKDLVATQEYTMDFSIRVPNSISALPQNEFAQTAMNIISTVSSSRRQVYWYIKGRVDLPGFDVTKKVKVTIN